LVKKRKSHSSRAGGGRWVRKKGRLDLCGNGKGKKGGKNKKKKKSSLLARRGIFGRKTD